MGDCERLKKDTPNKKFQWDRAGAQWFGPVFHLQSFTVQQSASLLAARLPEFGVMHELQMTEFEKKHQIVLPKVYRELSDIHSKLVIAGDTWEIIKPGDLDFYLSEASETSGFPTNGLPIAHNLSGSYVFILPLFGSDKFSSSLFFFNHETEEVYALSETIENLMDSRNFA